MGCLANRCRGRYADPESFLQGLWASSPSRFKLLSDEGRVAESEMQEVYGYGFRRVA